MADYPSAILIEFPFGENAMDFQTLRSPFEAGYELDLSLTALLLRPDFYIPIVGLAVLSLIPIVYRALTAKKQA